MRILGYEITKAADLATSKTPVDADTVARVSGQINDVTDHGPGVPMSPVGTQEEPRRWDYQPGRNVATQPRTYEAFSFDLLRSMCDGYDIARLAIEARKSEMRGLSWSIRPKAKRGISRSERKQREVDLEEAVVEVESFFHSPNKEDDFGTWLAMWLEDLFTIDAATIYLRPNRAGGLYGLEIIDGSTIKPIIDEYGRPPLPPLPAYDQVIKGVVYGEFTREQIVYAPYHQRTRSPYGYPPMEWVMLTVNRALRRQTLDMSLYSAGTIPAQWYKVPKEWTDSQLSELQRIFDEILTGNDEARAKVRFVPGGEGTGPVDMHKEPTNEVEQWLMHVTASAFGTSAFELGFEPSGSGLGGAGFGEASRENRIMRGTKPLANHIKRILDGVIAGPLGQPEVEFGWDDLEEEQDPDKVAIADKAYWSIGALSTDEIRDERMDRDPIGLEHTVDSASISLVSDLLDGPKPIPPGLAPSAGFPPEATEDTEEDRETPEVAEDPGVPDASGGDPGLDGMEKRSAEIRQWRKKAMRRVKEGKDPSAFVAEAIPEDEQAMIKADLAGAVTAAEVSDVFAKRGGTAIPLARRGSAGS